MTVAARLAGLVALVALAGALSACTESSKPPVLPSLSPTSVDRPGDAVVAAVCDRTLAAARRLLGDGSVTTPYAVHQPSPAVNGLPRMDCESHLMLCRKTPPAALALMQELDVTVADAGPSATPSSIPAGVTATQVDGVTVYVHDLYAGGDDTDPWFWLVVHNQRVDVQIILYNTLAEKGDERPNQPTLDACNTAWGKAWRQMAQAIITALR
ncbi:hypothetical protein [Dactylosporangium sp. CA-139066]|uniref:hypothetical protein n=1 Tax=Dactylosporangium sp. CA-139066 TaxID=3239930 RepID=UPI003D8C6AAB